MTTIATQNLHLTHNFSLQNKAFLSSIAVLVIALFVVLTQHFSSAEAQEQFDSRQFTLEIPVNFQRIPNPQVLLLLRYKSEGFPTFNAVLMSGAWPHSKLNLSEQAQKIAQDYRQVGLTNAEVSISKMVTVDRVPTLYAELNYQLESESKYSRVWVIMLSDRHIILTAIDKVTPGQNLTEQNLSEIDKIVASVKITPPRTAAATQHYSTNSSSNALTPFALLFLFASTMIYGTLKNRRKKINKN